MVTTREPGSYEVRFGARSALTLLLFFLLPLLLVVVGVLNWPQHSTMALVGAASCIPLAIAGASRIRGILHRRSIVVIDSRGVHLGQDDRDAPTVLEPWSAIDAVVYFDAKQRVADDEWERYIGVVRGGRIVKYRHLVDSRLNVARAADATARFGGGTPFREAPDISGLPEHSFTSLPLPDEWLQWAMRPDVRAIRASSERKRGNLFIDIAQAFIGSVALAIALPIFLDYDIAFPYVAAGVCALTAAIVLLGMPIRRAVMHWRDPDRRREAGVREI